MIRVLNSPYGEVIKFAVLTGLRPTEACEAVRLLNGLPNLVNPNNYYNQSQQCLEHFRLADIFLRPTKKAFISYLSRDNYHYFANLLDKPPTWDAIRHQC